MAPRLRSRDSQRLTKSSRLADRRRRAHQVRSSVPTRTAATAELVRTAQSNTGGLRRSTTLGALRRHLGFESLEDRRLLAIDLSGVVDWLEQGSQPITEASATAEPNNPASGGVEDLAIDPNNPAHMFAATINGGIWRTHDGDRPFNGVDDGGLLGADDPFEQPTWVPVSDQYPTLGINGIAFDPLDVTGNTVFAGTGSASSLSNFGGLPIGILKTTDDGESWSVFPLNPGGSEPQVRVVVPTTYDSADNPAVTQVVLVGTVSQGLYRSIDGGETYTQISGSGAGLPSGAVTDMVVDPNDDDVYYAGVVGQGVYRSADGGETWNDVNNAALSTNAALGSSTAVMLTAHAGGGTTRVYAMISYVDPDTANPPAVVPQIFTTTDDGASWTELATVTAGFESGFGSLYTDMASDQIIVDPADQGIVYIAKGYGGSPMILRYDPSGGGSWDQIENVAAVGNTRPHVDHRDLQFANSGGNDVLINANDGGLYFLVDPQNTPDGWVGLHGIGSTGLGVTENTNVTLDGIHGVLFGGAQDNGTSVQTAVGSRVWESFRGADGGDVQAADAGGGNSYRYSATQPPNAPNQNQSPIQRLEFSGPTAQVGAPVTLFPAAGLPGFVPRFVAQFELNSENSSRLIVGGGGASPVYELTNADTATGPGPGPAPAAQWTAVPIGPGFTTVNDNNDACFIVGGRLNGSGNEEVLIVCSGDDVFIRSTAGGVLTVTPTPFPGGQVQAVASDPENWQHLFVADASRIWETTDAGINWTEITRNLMTINSRLQSLAYIPTGGEDVILVGGNLGVSRLTVGSPDASWTRLSTNLPNALVSDLEYHASHDILLAGTFGRGAWIVENASLVVDETPVLTICGDENYINQDDVIRLVRNSANPLLLDVFLNNATAVPDASIPLAAIQQINVFGVGGNDVLDVESTFGLITVPGGIRYDGDGACTIEGAGSAGDAGFNRGFDTLRLTQIAGATVTTETLAVGQTPGSGLSTIVNNLGNADPLDDLVQLVYFEELEPVITNIPATNFNITSVPGLSSLLQDDNQINYSAGLLMGPNWGRVTIDNFELIEFIDKTNLTIDAGSGGDTINLNYQNAAQGAPDGLTGTITVNGQDPTGSDTLILNSRATVDDSLRLAPTAQGAGTVESASSGLPTTIFTGVEHLTIVLQSNELDSLAIDGTTGNDQWEFTPGATSDTGLFTGTMDLTGNLAAGPFPMAPTTFAGIDASAANVIINGDFTVPGGSGGDDSLIFNGTPGNDSIRVYDSGLGDVGLQNSINVALFSNINFLGNGGETVIVRGHAGDDLFTHDNGGGIDDVVRYEGGSPGSGSDVLHLLGDTSAGAVENVTIRPDATIPTDQDVVGLGSAIDVSGIELIAYQGFPDDSLPPVPNDSLTVELGDGDNWARVERGSDFAGVDADLLTSDSLPDIQFTGLDTLTVDAGGGEDEVKFHTWLLAGVDNYIIDGGADSDVLTIEGTSSADLIDVFQPAASNVATDNYTLSITVNATVKIPEITKTITASAPSAPANLPTVEEVRIVAGNGNDTIRVGHADAYTDADAAASVPDQRLRITVVGGEPNASDRLAVRDDGDGDLVLVRQANDERSGRVTVAPAAAFNNPANAGAGDVVYEGIERLDITPVDPVTGGAGADGGGRLVVFQADPFELNDNRLTTTEFEDLSRIHRNPTIDPGAGPFDLPGDEDWYEFRASKIGTFRFDVYYDRITTTTNGRPGLPGNGDLGIAVYNRLGQLIVHGQADTLAPNSEVTASATFSAAQGQVYYLRVRGGSEARDNDEAINTYFATVTEVDLLGPQVFDPDGDGPEQAIQIITDGVVNETFNLFEIKPDGIDQGPTPLVTGLLINVRDLLTRELLRRAPGDPLSDIYPALDQIVAEAIGNYRVVGDHTGVIAIESVVVNNDIPDDRRAISATITAQNNLTTFTAAGLIDSEVVAGDLVVFESTTDPDLNGQIRVIDTFDPATGQIVVTDPFLDMPLVGDDLTILRIATATITLTFAEPLPDDRFTLVIDDSLTDPPGNLFDGESDASQPTDAPAFPSGDGVSGGDFVARFTVDSRAEIGVWAAGSVWIDTNGNFIHDPENMDDNNEDITYVLGFPTDNVFAGNFVQNAAADADGFDKLAAYGWVAGQFRWLIDTDNDGVPNIVQPNSPSVNALPLAGNFDGDASNGDEVGLFNGQTWFLDTNHNFQTTTLLQNSNMTGYPFAGDFDGDGIDDLGTFADDKIQLDLSGPDGIDGQWDRQFTFGFTGVRDRAFAADFDGDDIDDIGLWSPDGRGATPEEVAEWYIFVSDGRTIDERLRPNPEIGGVGTIIDFVPIPFGADIYAAFGNAYALPVVGNFDPPVVPLDSGTLTTLRFTNVDAPTDVNRDGLTTPGDALYVINYLNVHGSGALPRITVRPGTTPNGPLLDTTADWVLSPADVVRVINKLNQQVGRFGSGGEGEDGAPLMGTVPAGLTAIGNSAGGPGPSASGLVAIPLTLTSVTDGGEAFGGNQDAAAPLFVADQILVLPAAASQSVRPPALAIDEVSKDVQPQLDELLDDVLDDLADDVCRAWATL